jgi:hypothetical protein
MTVQVGDFLLSDDNPYPGIPEPFRSNENWLKQQGILPDPTRNISQRFFFVGQRVQHRTLEFGRPCIRPAGMDMLYLADFTGTVRGFVEYHGKILLLVHWDGTPVLERREQLSMGLSLGFYWCNADNVEILP